MRRQPNFLQVGQRYPYAADGTWCEADAKRVAFSNRIPAGAKRNLVGRHGKNRCAGGSKKSVGDVWTSVASECDEGRHYKDVPVT